MNIETKDFPVVDGEATDEFPYGTFELILSAPTLDRDGEVVDSKAFEPLPDHITFDTDHSMTCDSVVGSGAPYYAEDGTLRVKGGYCADDRSQTIRQKVKDKHIRTSSVTFMAAKREKDEKGIPHIVKAELLNGTFTPVPSNREATVLAAKSVLVKEGRRNSTTDAANIQAAHDAMVAVGADCGTKSTGKAETKAIVGSVEALQERVSDALEDAYGDGDMWWGWLRGVVPSDDTSGYCVFQQNGDTYRQDYTDDGAVVTLVADAAEVDIHEIVAPDADADRETDTAPAMNGMRSAADSADPAAHAAGSAESAADTVPDEVKAALEARRNTMALL